MKMRPFECSSTTARNDHILRTIVSRALSAQSARLGIPAIESRTLNDQAAIPDWSLDQAHLDSGVWNP